MEVPMLSLHAHNPSWWRARRLRLALALATLASLLAGSLGACSTTGPTVALPATPKVVVRSSDPMTAEPRGENFAVAKCLAGEQLVGGGYLLTPGAFPIA